jgi:hypothetical protein
VIYEHFYAIILHNLKMHKIVITVMPQAAPVDDEIVVTFAEHEFRRYAAGVDEEIVL